ncbi:hypothetical protein GE09DRAFT_283087 [Coniochaeta sp. 2T2.1]|nr:hypothetical protein GE09DRAFT_283087 [Coniochaeta sp. 2T2.1]
MDRGIPRPGILAVLAHLDLADSTKSDWATIAIQVIRRQKKWLRYDDGPWDARLVNLRGQGTVFPPTNTRRGRWNRDTGNTSPEYWYARTANGQDGAQGGHVGCPISAMSSADNIANRPSRRIDSRLDLFRNIPYQSHREVRDLPYRPHSGGDTSMQSGRVTSAEE